MKLGYGNCFALIVHKVAAEIVRVRKDRGVGHSFFRNNDYLLSVEDYEENLDLHTWSNGHYIESTHVVATAARADLLPPVTTVALPSKAEVDAALPAILAEIGSSRLSSQMRDYLKLLLAEENRYKSLILSPPKPPTAVTRSSWPSRRWRRGKPRFLQAWKRASAKH